MIPSSLLLASHEPPRAIHLCSQIHPRERETYPSRPARAPMGCQTQPTTSVVNTRLQYETVYSQVYRHPAPSIKQVVSLVHYWYDPIANTYNLVGIDDGLQPMSDNYLSHIMQLVTKRKLDRCIRLVVCKGL
jgi:hypothetical protein